MWSLWCLEHAAGMPHIWENEESGHREFWNFSPPLHSVLSLSPWDGVSQNQGGPSFLSEGLWKNLPDIPRRGSPRWFPIQASWQRRLVNTPCVRSHPNPANKQTNKEVHGFLGDWTYDLMITCRCSPTMESYKALFCFLCGTIGT